MSGFKQDALLASQAISDILAQAKHLRNHNSEAALELAQKALSCLHGSKSLAHAESLYLCAELAYDLSNYLGSIDYAQEALETFQALEYPNLVIDTLETLGKNHEKLGHFQEALRCHQRALALSQVQKDTSRAGESLLNLGILCYDQSDYPSAVDYYIQALKITREDSNDYWQARVLGCLGNAFERMGDYARALAYHQQCLQGFSREPYLRERSFALNNIGNVYFALGEYQEAISFHQQSLDLKRQLKDRWGEGSSLQNLGACYLAMDSLSKAEAYFLESLPIVETISDQEGISIALQGLGDIAAKRKDFEKAIHFYQPSLEISTALGDRYNQVQSLLNIGQIYKQQLQLSEAHQALSTALRLSIDIQAKRLSQQIHEELSTVYELSDNLPAALEHQRGAYRLEREVFSNDLEGKLRSLKFHFELESAEKEKELYRLKHIELAHAYEELKQAHEDLAKANLQKEKLLKTLEKQKRQLERQSTHDALTGLYNRRYFDKELAKAFRDSRRYGKALSVVISDIDNFKKINDRFSHQIGDEVLKAIARLLKKYSRETDIVARYGGEEFALLLTNTSAQDAAKVCEKIRYLIEQHPWHTIHPDLKVTMSTGISDDIYSTTYEQIMALADNRLYQAKHNGKNQIVI